MDFNRNNQPFRANPEQARTEAAAKDTTPRKKANRPKRDFMSVANFVVLVCTAFVLLGAVILLTRAGGDENTFVDENAYQAIDVVSGGSNGDQVYFGKIVKVTGSQVVLSNVFYPVANSNADDNKVTTLVPFVCSLASPSDQLVLNRAQVAYWYNLQSDSKVSKTIDQYKKDNKNKANCDNLTTGDKNSAAGNETMPAPTDDKVVPTNDKDTANDKTAPSADNADNNKPANKPEAPDAPAAKPENP